MVPKTDDIDLREVVADFRACGFEGFCGVAEGAIDLTIHAKNPPDAERQARSLLEPDYAGLFRINVGMR